MNLYLVVAINSSRPTQVFANPFDAQPFEDNPGYVVYTIPGVYAGIMYEEDM